MLVSHIDWFNVHSDHDRDSISRYNKWFSFEQLVTEQTKEVTFNMGLCLGYSWRWKGCQTT